jgi:uncharacterized protein YqiB (DUF1249 family)
MMLPWCHDVYRLLARQPTVGDLMDLCEESYRYLERMAPDLRAMQGSQRSRLRDQTDLHLEVLEQSPYTTLARLTYFFPRDEAQGEPEPDALLRVFHDARQVEVVGLRQRALPLERLFHSPGLRNRWRANLFISRWLAFCANQGHRFVLNAETDLPDVCSLP